jgi:hypothetical protein
MTHDETPWDEAERRRGGPEPEQAAAERLLTFWHRLFSGAFHPGDSGATQVTVARLLKVISDADFMLARLVGHGSIQVGVRFDTRFAADRADELEARLGESSPSIDAIREIAAAWADDLDTAGMPPTTPHLLMAALWYWCQGQEITWAAYRNMLPRLASRSFAQLAVDLHLVDPALVAAAQARISELPVKVAAPVFVRFEDRDSDARTRDYGPYAWTQLVHDELKVAPSGAHIATLMPGAGDAPPRWIVFDPAVPDGSTFTDVVIGPAEVSDGGGTAGT